MRGCPKVPKHALFISSRARSKLETVCSAQSLRLGTVLCNCRLRLIVWKLEYFFFGFGYIFNVHPKLPRLS